MQIRAEIIDEKNTDKLVKRGEGLEREISVVRKAHTKLQLLNNLLTSNLCCGPNNTIIGRIAGKAVKYNNVHENTNEVMEAIRNEIKNAKFDSTNIN